MSASDPQKEHPAGSRPESVRRVGSDGTVFKCPMCKAILPGTEVPTFPFCSERCKLLDLGQWLEGKYRVSRPIDPTDQLEEMPRSRPEAPPQKPEAGSGGQ